MVGEQIGALLELEAGNRIAVGVEFALSHGTNWVNGENLRNLCTTAHLGHHDGIGENGRANMP